MNNNLCLCGCGGEVKKGNKYINGHNKSTLGKKSKFKGKTFEESFGKEKAKEISEKLKVGKFGDSNPAKREDVRIKISRSRRGKLTGDNNPNYWKGRKNPGQSQRMKENNPSFKEDVKKKARERMLERWKNMGSIRIGNNETEILDFIEKETSFLVHRQFSVIGYSLDGYIHELNLAIEIDEPHHYIDGVLRISDMDRQMAISEELGCQFFRVKNNISLNELKGELKKFKV